MSEKPKVGERYRLGSLVVEVVEVSDYFVITQDEDTGREMAFGFLLWNRVPWEKLQIEVGAE